MAILRCLKETIVFTVFEVNFVKEEKLINVKNDSNFVDEKTIFIKNLSKLYSAISLIKTLINNLIFWGISIPVQQFAEIITEDQIGWNLLQLIFKPDNLLSKSLLAESSVDVNIETTTFEPILIRKY